ncbi:uncharacterized protein LOC113471543 [Diaphorina citri]|uniref:Uncharacterized protein LOC113471543 n=1 Tax=Diaphorina citri TaxID=121845 RepID=A0A3Q0JIK5_DIACI|nr:uncharacterized protein LOC113471543 [Diaphorina citri]
MFNELYPEEATVSETSNEVKEENEVDSVEEKPVSVTTTYGDINITLSSSSDDITEEPPEQEPSDTCLVITIAERNQRNFIQQLINLRDEVDRRRTQVTLELDEEKKKTKKIHGNLKDLEKKKRRYQVCFQKKFGNLRKVKRLKRQMRREIEVLKENSVHRFEEIENCRPQTLPNRTFYVKLLKVCPCNCNAKQNLITVRYLVNTTTLLGNNVKKIHRNIDEEMVARFDAKENVSELTE